MSGTIVLDVDGVIVLGGEPIPGAGAALADLEAMGCRLIIATNNASRSPQQTADRLQRLVGHPFDPGCVVTSTVALAGMLRPQDHPVLVVGEEGMKLTLRDHGVALTDDPEEAATVAVGMDRGFDYALLDRASLAVRRGARFIASNTDATFPTPRGVAPGAGALVAAVERAAGTTPEVAGKPHEPMRRAVERCLAPGPVWMVGDRPETDLAFGSAAGWITVLALSGVTTDVADVPDGLKPDLVIRDLAGLPSALDQKR